MIYEIKNIELDYSKLNIEKSDYTPYMKVFVPNLDGDVKQYSENCTRPTILILPGGGYRFKSEREAEPVANKFLARGFNVCILYYSTAPAVFPASMLEAMSALKYIRENLKAWQGSPDKVYVCGFSAGGHLAASVGVHWNSDIAASYFGDTELVRPNGMILSYPVITSDEKLAHAGSFINLLGENKDNAELLKFLSLEKQVTKSTPPAFLWTTFEDVTVPCENTMLFASALREQGIPFEMHVFEKGPHGGSTGEKVCCAESYKFSAWVDMACEWCLDTRAVGK